MSIELENRLARLERAHFRLKPALLGLGAIFIGCEGVKANYESVVIDAKGVHGPERS